jgi:hypothetical protein
MNTLEERVRAATRAAGDTVAPDSVPPLRLPSSDAARSRGGSRSSASAWARRLAPVAAAVAVVALAIAMVNLSKTVSHSAPTSSSAPPSSPAPSTSGLATASPDPVMAGPSMASYVAAGLVPAYYVSIESHGHPGTNPSYAVVRSTVTGAVLGTIAAAGGGTIAAVTAAADDKTFVLDERPWVPSNSYAHTSAEPRTFVMFRLGASGQPGTLTRLPVSMPAGALLTGFALSPDGSQLAIAVQPNNVKKDRNLLQIRTYSLRTGAVRTWSADGRGIGQGADDPMSLSWTADERTLAFNWSGLGGDVGVRLLNLRAPGGNLLADSRQAMSTKDPTEIGWPPRCLGDPIITPDGTRLVCGGETYRQRIESAFLEFSASTGSVTRVLGHWTFPAVDVPNVFVMWSDTSGSVLIGLIPDTGEGRVGVIRGNEFTPLPTSPGSGPSVDDTW